MQEVIETKKTRKKHGDDKLISLLTEIVQQEEKVISFAKTESIPYREQEWFGKAKRVLQQYK